MAMSRGSCLCGEVVYEIDGKIQAMHYCHCSKCRKATGSAFMSSSRCRKDDLRWVKGEDSRRVYGDPVWKIFCSNCGSPTPVDMNDGYVWIPGGCLEDVDLQFTHHIFVGLKRRGSTSAMTLFSTHNASESDSG